MADDSHGGGGEAAVPANGLSPAGEFHPANSRRFWDEAAEGFDTFHSVMSLFDTFHSVMSLFSGLALDYAQEHMDKIIATCQSPVMLDVPAGTGPCAIQASQRFPTAKILATDWSEGMVRVMRRKMGGAGIANVDVKVMDGQDMKDVADSTVDVLTCNFGMNCFPVRIRGWREIYRVLKPGGRAVVSNWKSMSPHVVTAEAVAKYEEEEEEKEKEKKKRNEKEAAAAAAAAGGGGGGGGGGILGEQENGGAAMAEVVEEERRRQRKAAWEAFVDLFLRLSSASVIAEDLVSAGCQFTSVEFHPVSHVWEGVAEEEIDRMTTQPGGGEWAKAPGFDDIAAGRDLQLLMAKLNEVMRSRLNEQRRVSVPCEVLVTVLVK